jgi:hypothetical protein
VAGQFARSAPMIVGKVRLDQSRIARPAAHPQRELFEVAIHHTAFEGVARLQAAFLSTNGEIG